MGYFRLFQGANEEYYFNLNANNHKLIIQSEGYTTKQNAEKGIESVRKNSKELEHFEERMSKDDRPYFVLKAGNGEVIGVSQMYQEKGGMLHGMDSVHNNAPDAELRDET